MVGRSSICPRSSCASRIHASTLSARHVNYVRGTSACTVPEITIFSDWSGLTRVQEAALTAGRHARICTHLSPRRTRPAPFSFSPDSQSRAASLPFRWSARAAALAIFSRPLRGVRRSPPLPRVVFARLWEGLRWFRVVGFGYSVRSVCSLYFLVSVL